LERKEEEYICNGKSSRNEPKPKSFNLHINQKIFSFYQVWFFFLKKQIKELICSAPAGFKENQV
jgi:hypothetical protein